MSGIFISYRREDSAPYAGRLYDRLCGRFGADQVFMDVDDIPPGEELRADLEPLARRNALTLNDPEFQRDADNLVQTLERFRD
jgi:TIR domain